MNNSTLLQALKEIGREAIMELVKSQIIKFSIGFSLVSYVLLNSKVIVALINKL